MYLKLFNTMSITKFAGSAFDCSCGREHAAQTRDIYFEAGAANAVADAVEKIVPPLSLIGIITDTNARAAEARLSEKSLARKGYRVSLFCFENSPLACIDSVNEVSFPEDVRAIVAIGGGTIIDIAKFKSQLMNVDFVAVPTTPACIGFLTPSAILFDGKVEQIFKTRAPKAIVTDLNILATTPKKFSAAAFGALASKYVALFDYKFAHFINREVFCEEIFDQSMAILDEATNALSKPGKSKKEINSILAELNLKYSALSQLTGNSRLMCGGEAQGAHALNLLFNYEQREKKMRGEDEFLFARVIIKLYKNLLSKRAAFFVPPPDNNMRLEKIEEFLGLEEAMIINKIRPVISGEQIQFCSYRFEEYREELLLLAASLELRLKSAWKIFKRLYDDDGYSLLHYIDEADVSLCVSVAPDLKEKYTMLTYMKNAGYLDGYLLDLIV